MSNKLSSSLLMPGTAVIWNQNTLGTAAGLSTTLVVASGGTGATALTGIVVGNGSSPFTTVTAPGGAIVGTVDGQTLTNKIITTVALYETKVVMITANYNIDLLLGNLFTKTISTTSTFTVSNTPTAGTVASFIFEVINGGSYSITWWSGVRWVGGGAPVLTTTGKDSLGFYTHDGGTNWIGVIIGKDIR